MSGKKLRGKRENVVCQIGIGAGSVVTRDIPANVIAVGNPCRVAREIGERDRLLVRQ